MEAKLEQRLSAPPPEVYTAKASIDRELEGFFDVKIKQEDANKFRCMVPKCNKLFMTAEFVKKHLRLKHQDLINQIKEKVPSFIPFILLSFTSSIAHHHHHVGRR